MSSSECSESDSDYENETGSVGTNETFSSISAALESMREKLELFGEGVDNVHSSVQQMEHPVAAVALASFVQPRFLETAPFRWNHFTLTEEAKVLFGTEKSTVRFKTFCALLREYLFSNNMVSEEGYITYNDDLRDLLDVTDTQTQTTFLGLLAHLEKFVR
jgi:hypothetical protein